MKVRCENYDKCDIASECSHSVPHDPYKDVLTFVECTNGRCSIAFHFGEGRPKIQCKPVEEDRP